MKKITLILITAFYTLLVQASEDSFILPINRKENTPFIELNTEYYYTNSNYTEYFDTIYLSEISNASNDAFMHYAGQDLSIGYTMQHWIELELFLKGFWFAQNSHRSLSIITNNIKTIKRFGMALRSHQKWGRDSGGFIPEFSFSAPIYKVNYSSSVPIVDDGSLHFTPSVWLYLRTLSILYPYVQIGVKLRPQPVSSFVTWKIGTMLKWNIFEAGIHYYGLWTMIKEKSSSESRKKIELLSYTNAGSQKFLSSNPGVMGFTSWLGLNLYNLSLRLSGDIDIFGQNYAKGYSAMLSIIFQIEPKRKIERLFNDKQEFKIQSQETPSTLISEDPLLEVPPEEPPLTDEDDDKEEELLNKEEELLNKETEPTEDYSS